MPARTRRTGPRSGVHVPTLLLLVAIVLGVVPVSRAAAVGGETAVTAPAALTVGPHLSDHPAGGFTLSGFAADLSLLVRVWIEDAPTGVTFSIGTPTGLTASGGTVGWTGHRHLTFRGTTTAVQAALDTLTLTTGAATGPLDLRIQVHPDPGPTSGLVIEPLTGHLYRFVSGDRDWHSARDAAESGAFAFDGVTGHLVTITSAAENAFVRANAPTVDRLWLGMNDQADEDTWRWVTGPEGLEAGGSGRRISSGYSNWASGEPDDSFFSGCFGQREDYGVMYDNGRWGDRCSGSSVGGHVVEYSEWDGTFPSMRTAALTTTVARPARAVAATHGNRKATVTWQAPEFGTVTGYTVTTELAAGGGADPLPGCTTTGALSCTVTGLTNDVEVVFTVETAFTDEGTSRSSPSAGVTPFAPPARAVAATHGNRKATVTWQAPEFGTVTGYTVTTELAAGGGADPLPGCTTTGALSCTVTGLRNGDEVVFTVETAFTGDEEASRSSPSAGVTPFAPPPPPPAPDPDPELAGPTDPVPPDDLAPPAGMAEVPTETPQDPSPDADSGSENVPEPGTEPGTDPGPADGSADPGDVADGSGQDAVSTTSAADPDAERRPPFPTFSALEEPEALVATATSGLALLGVAGSAAAAAGAAAGAARGGSRSRGGGSRSRDGGSRSGASRGEEEVEREGASGIDVLALGAAITHEDTDRARLYRWPGTARVDRASMTLMRRTAVPLPLIARVVEDGAALRAMFGSLALLLPATGILLGVLAVLDTGGIAMPPSTVLMVAIVLLGLLDAATGMTTFLTFAVGVALLGGIVDGDSVRTLLGVGVASFGPGLTAALFRPLRRPPARTPDERWERVTDATVVAVIGAMSVQLMVGALSGIAGYALPVSDIAGPLALAAFPVLALRVGLEELAARHVPGRLRAIIPDDVPEAPTWRTLLTLAVKAVVFVFVGLALIGPVWQLYAAALLFIFAPLVGLAADRLPNSPLLWRLLPQGVPGFVLMLLVGGWSAGLVESWLGATPDYAQMSFVALSVPYTLLALLGLVGREGAEGEDRWVQAPQRRALQRIGGIVMLAALIRLHLG